MANSTFSGPVRSESTFKTISKNATTGTITEVSTLGDGPVSFADGNVTLTNATHSGRILLVPDGGQDTPTLCLRLLLGQYFGLFTRAVRQMQLMRLLLPQETPTST